MNARYRNYAKAAVLLLGSALSMNTAKAQIVSHSKEVVIVQPQDLPELAQRPGIAFQLYTGSGDGSAYLYVEQHNGQRLVVFDVTDPAHIKMVRAVALSVPGPFDFVQSIGISSTLICYQSNQGVAMLDLHKPKAPVLRPINNMQCPGRVQALDESTYLMANDHLPGIRAVSSNYQVIDASDRENPVLLYGAKLVKNTITRQETGTTFLLGSDGLTVIRHPRVEDEYRAAQQQVN